MFFFVIVIGQRGAVRHKELAQPLHGPRGSTQLLKLKKFNLTATPIDFCFRTRARARTRELIRSSIAFTIALVPHASWLGLLIIDIRMPSAYSTLDGELYSLLASFQHAIRPT